MNIKDLRQAAKARKIPKYYNLNKAQLMSALGMRESKEKQAAAVHKRAIDAHASRIDGAKKEELKARIVKSVKRDLTRKEKELGRKLSQDEKRQVAAKSLMAEVKAIKAGAPEKKGRAAAGKQKPPAETTKPKATRKKAAAPKAQEPKPPAEITKPKATRKKAVTPEAQEPKAEERRETAKQERSEGHKKIKSSSDFQKETLGTIHQLNRDYNYDGLVPIHEVRKALGERVSRSEFDSWLKDMNANNKIDLIGGEMPGLTPEIRRNSVTTALGAPRFYVKPLAVAPEARKTRAKGSR